MFCGNADRSHFVLIDFQWQLLLEGAGSLKLIFLWSFLQCLLNSLYGSVKII